MKEIAQLTPDEKKRGTELIVELRTLLHKNRRLEYTSQVLQILMREKCILLKNTPTELYVQFPNSSLPQQALDVCFIAYDLNKLNALAEKERVIFNNNAAGNRVASQMTLGFINSNSPTEAELDEILDRTLNMFQPSK